jgi:hypothetical protein
VSTIIPTASSNEPGRLSLISQRPRKGFDHAGDK